MEKKEKDTENSEDEGINLLDYFLVLLKRKELIITITFSAVIITILYALTLTKMYEASTDILLPQQQGQNMARQFLTQFIDLGSISGSSINDPLLYMQLFKSTPVYDRMIERFNLVEHYKTTSNKIAEKFGLSLSSEDDYIAYARGQISSLAKTKFVLPGDTKRFGGFRTSRIIRVSVVDKDPAKAADMANAFVEEFQNYLKDIAVTESSQKRLFFEQQLTQAKEDLIKAEEAMREFQEKTGVLKADQQAGAIVESIANLRAQMIAKQVELNVMKSYSTPNNPDLQRIEETIKGLRKELAKLEQKDNNSSDTFLTTGEMPAIGTDYFRKLRDLKLNETLYEIMIKQYELAKIEEAKDPSIIQVIEKATPPKTWVYPARRKMVIRTTLLSFFFSVLLVFFIEFIERYKSRSSENREKIETLKKFLSFRKKM